MPEQDSAAPRGLGGWLILPLVHLIANAAALLWHQIQRFPMLLAAEPHHRIARVILHMMWSRSWLMFMFVALCLWRFLKRRKDTAIYLTVFYGWVTAANLMLLMEWRRADSHLVVNQSPAMAVSYMLTAAVAVAMLIYVHTSVRVKNTFTVDEPALAPAGERTGLGGVLLVPLVLLTLWCGIGLVTVGQRLAELPSRLPGELAHGHYAALFAPVVPVALLLASFYCLFVFLNRKRQARWLLSGFFGLLLVVSAAKLLFNPPPKLAGGIIVCLLSGAMAAYFVVSKRVQNTFTR